MARIGLRDSSLRRTQTLFAIGLIVSLWAGMGACDTGGGSDEGCEDGSDCGSAEVCRSGICVTLADVSDARSETGDVDADDVSVDRSDGVEGDTRSSDTKPDDTSGADTPPTDGTETGADSKTNVSFEDGDGDGSLDQFDNCPVISNPEQADRDDDGIGDACDSCPSVANAGGAPCELPTCDETDPDCEPETCDGEDDDLDGAVDEGCPSCKLDGRQCTADSDCCNGHCSRDGVCEPPCRPKAVSCTSDSDCCSGTCGNRGGDGIGMCL